MDTLAKKLLRRLSALKCKQATWHRAWEACARYCAPNFAPLKKLARRPDGAQKEQPLDSTGIIAATRLAAWLYSTTIYQGEEWFSLKARHRDGDLVPYGEEEFLQKAASAVLDCISSSNFSKIYQQSLLGYVVFGTNPIYVEFNEDDELVCRQFAITEGIYLAENAKGEIDTVFREFEYTARQAVEAFGKENVSDEIRKAFDSDADKDKVFRFAHCVYPRDNQPEDRRKRLPKYKKFASVYIEVAREKVVEEGGTDTFPYGAPRFTNTGEVYGRSPAMEALPALRSVNMETYIYIENTRAIGKPVSFAPTSIADDVDLSPGAVNPYNSDEGSIVLWSASGDLRSSLEFIERQRAAIKTIFFNDAFEYLEDRKNMTATEAQLRYDEMIQGISPVLSNLQNDFFKPLIERIVLHLIEVGRIKVPAEYRTKEGDVALPQFDIIYSSRLDTKLKGVQNADLLTCVRMLAELFQYSQSPAMAARVDFDKIAEKIVANNNVAGLGVLLDEDTVKANLESQAQMQQLQQFQNLYKPLDAQKTPEQGSTQQLLTEGYNV